ncbi:MAG: ABC transporter ATP-binding protein/permease [Lachnospiraceae bacterium]|nr:ABC transporter ATP-binding protein/permease [Ruminococcus sp.]MCM1275366.1 ABC transporter ATP-binding protein/permease [Lachnospiraceae bacterium]
MIKTLIKCVRDAKLPAILTPVFVLLESLIEVSIASVMADLIDFGITPGDMNNVIKYGVILLVQTLGALFFGATAGYTASRASSRFARNLRADMYSRIQEYSFSNIDKFSPASLVTRLTTDVQRVQMSFQMITRVVFRAPAMLIFAFTFAFRTDHKLSLIFLAVIPFLAIVLAIIIKTAFPIFNKTFVAYDDLNEVVEENVHGIRVVKNFVQEKSEIKKFRGVSDRIYSLFTKAEKTVAFNAPAMQISVYTCMLLISWFGAQAIVASGNDELLGLTTGGLMSMFTYTMQILMSLMMLSMIFVMLTMSKASADRVAEVLNEKSDINDGERNLTEVKDGSIEFKDVSFKYFKTAESNALDHIDLKIKSGETVGIIGGTGSSKSTLVSMIPRLYDVSEGEVLVGGEDVRDYNIEALRTDVAMVLQKNVLFSGTIYENVRWGDENATDEEVQKVCRLACADDFIQSFPKGYDTYIEQGGTNVSGGQKQRLCIARALLKKPKILILDDSTSAVDTKTDAMIRKAFREEIPNTTKIIIAQRVSSVCDADKIIILDNGRIAECGTHDELYANSDIYREIYDSQTKGAEEDE